MPQFHIYISIITTFGEWNAFVVEKSGICILVLLGNLQTVLYWEGGNRFEFNHHNLNWSTSFVHPTDWFIRGFRYCWSWNSFQNLESIWFAEKLCNSFYVRSTLGKKLETWMNFPVDKLYVHYFTTNVRKSFTDIVLHQCLDMGPLSCCFLNSPMTEQYIATDYLFSYTSVTVSKCTKCPYGWLGNGNK